MPRKLDKASNSYKVSHHLITTEGNDYRIDGITVSSVWYYVGLKSTMHGTTVTRLFDAHNQAITFLQTTPPLSI